ncbi:MAG: HPF/RaiA family ribosome-associated protein [Myxococcales bacterium]|nr:HPF/RaiA family ribosome-associated protein [Myxococcales bacterium]
MNITVEAQNVHLADQFRSQIEERIAEYSDPRDPVVSARATLTYNDNEVPPANVGIVMGLRKKDIVVSKAGETVDFALKSALDTAKREIRKHYDQRGERKFKHHPKEEQLKEFSTVPPESE